METTTEVNLPHVSKYIASSPSKTLDLILSPAYCMQEKIDGRRLIMVKTSHGVLGYNKRYESAMPPKWLSDAVAALPGAPWIFDGELTEDGNYWIFDMTSFPSNDCKALPYDERQMLLGVAMRHWKDERLHKLPAFFDPQDKFMHLLAARRHGAEGVVFRPREVSPYFQGQIYKYKFYQSVDAVVMDLRTEGKEAITIGVFDGGDVVEIGKCKIDHEKQDKMKTFSTVVEVRHRGLRKPLDQGGRLLEPVFIRVRDDKRAYTCTSDQLAAAMEPASMNGVKHAAFENIVGIDRDRAIQLIKGEQVQDDNDE